MVYFRSWSSKNTLLRRGFFVFPPLTKIKKKPLPGRVKISSAFVSIRPKVWTGKYQDHLANDGVSSHVLDRKTNEVEKASFFPSHQRGKFKETSAKQGI